MGRGIRKKKKEKEEEFSLFHNQNSPYTRKIEIRRKNITELFEAGKNCLQSKEKARKTIYNKEAKLSFLQTCR